MRTWKNNQNISAILIATSSTGLNVPENQRKTKAMKVTNVTNQTCDTLDEMEDWMDTTGKDYGEEHSGTSNLVDALDTITWWATYSFFHLDENPVRNSYLEE